MEGQITGHVSYKTSPGIENPHYDTTVVSALTWPRLMDYAENEISFRPEEPTGRRVLIQKCAVQKDLMFIVTDTGDERCSR
jgi:hypothetical protein